MTSVPRGEAPAARAGDAGEANRLVRLMCFSGGARCVEKSAGFRLAVAVKAPHRDLPAVGAARTRLGGVGEQTRHRCHLRRRHPRPQRRLVGRESEPHPAPGAVVLEGQQALSHPGPPPPLATSTAPRGRRRPSSRPRLPPTPTARRRWVAQLVVHDAASAAATAPAGRRGATRRPRAARPTSPRSTRPRARATGCPPSSARGGGGCRSPPVPRDGRHELTGAVLVERRELHERSVAVLPEPPDHIGSGLPGADRQEQPDPRLSLGDLVQHGGRRRIEQVGVVHGERQGAGAGGCGDEAAGRVSRPTPPDRPSSGSRGASAPKGTVAAARVAVTQPVAHPRWPAASSQARANRVRPRPALPVSTTARRWAPVSSSAPKPASAAARSISGTSSRPIRSTAPARLLMATRRVFLPLGKSTDHS